MTENILKDGGDAVAYVKKLAAAIASDAGEAREVYVVRREDDVEVTLVELNEVVWITMTREHRLPVKAKPKLRIVR